MPKRSQERAINIEHIPLKRNNRNSIGTAISNERKSAGCNFRRLSRKMRQRKRQARAAARERKAQRAAIVREKAAARKAWEATNRAALAPMILRAQKGFDTDSWRKELAQRYDARLRQ
ncbi:MAG: hypothetical protein ACE5FM_04895, partial [Methyloligellaceae bacterium]